jgi:hypothetical protein
MLQLLFGFQSLNQWSQEYRENANTEALIKGNCTMF